MQPQMFPYDGVCFVGIVGGHSLGRRCNDLGINVRTRVTLFEVLPHCIHYDLGYSSIKLVKCDHDTASATVQGV